MEITQIPPTETQLALNRRINEQSPRRVLESVYRTVELALEHLDSGRDELCGEHLDLAMAKMRDAGIDRETGRAA